MLQFTKKEGRQQMDKTKQNKLNLQFKKIENKESRMNKKSNNIK